MDNESLLGTHTEKLEQHEKRLDKIDTILDKVRNRPPIWCTFAFGALFGVIGWLIRAL